MYFSLAGSFLWSAEKRAHNKPQLWPWGITTTEPGFSCQDRKPGEPQRFSTRRARVSHISLSSVRTEPHCHGTCRPREAPAGPGPGLKALAACREPLSWGRTEPVLPGCSETTSAALWAQLPPQRPAHFPASSCCWSGLCDPGLPELCQRHFITVKTSTACDSTGASPVATAKGQCL